MKHFKAQVITTPQVIERVKNLFRGYNNLILGFNTFLPEGEGFKIELTPEEQESGYHINSQIAIGRSSQAADGSLADRPEIHMYSRPPYFAAPPPNMAGGSSVYGGEVPPPGVGAPGANGPMNGAPHAAGVPQQQAGNPALSANAAGGAGTPGMNKQPQQMQQQHAITYVTTIRNRFQNEPETYRAFLRILHTYQKEQKGIKDVLEQVSQLFADHPDLLMEFTYFLPDSVQEQAKERLQRAAKESEARRRAMATNAYHPSMGGPGGPSMQSVPASLMSKKRRMNGEGGGRGGGGEGSGGPGRGKGAPGLMRKTGLSRKALAAEGLNTSLGAASGGEYGVDKSSNEVMFKTERMSKPGGQPSGSGSGSSLYKVPNQLSSSKHQMQQYQHVSGTEERRFFDHAKEVLQQVSRDNWAEFVKTLELFCNGSISRSDLLLLVRDLFGGQAGLELYEEFRRLLALRAEYELRGSDLWFAVPLSEIDFTQCRKCTPSYRALPKDFPKQACSERSPEEARELNDEWASIPIGSEESYSFKHMRKNQYEEALFRCEDERFEIDMIVDSNASTIRILEPLAQEIEQLVAMEEAQAAQIASGSAALTMSPKFNFQLDKRNLTAVHLNAIARLYGEHGAEILELLRKNPVGTIPVLLKRLKQKDLEWRKARVELNRQWKETVLRSYEKSFDHRSFYFRQQDKRICNHKYLVSEIKAFAESGGASAPVPAATSGSTSAAAAADDAANSELTQPGLSRKVSPDNNHLLFGISPHLVMKYDAKEYTVHRDVFRILSHVVETTIASQTERDRAAALWRDLLRVFFNLPTHFLYPASLAHNTEVPGPGHLDTATAWQAGTRVITTFGPGKIISYRRSDNFYAVALAFGTAYLRPSAVIGAEELSTQALRVIGVTSDVHSGDDIIFDGAVNKASSHSSTSTPSDHTSGSGSGSGGVTDPSKLFFGTQMAYIFLRLHHVLFTRLSLARQLARDQAAAAPTKHPLAYLDDASDDEGDRAADGNDHAAGAAGGHGPSGENRYSAYLALLHSFVAGTTDATRYEECCRQLLGNQSFVLYTLDKVVQHAVKCLQAMANDDCVHKLVGLFVYHRGRRSGAASQKGSATGAASAPGAASAGAVSTHAEVDPDLYLSHVGAILAHTMEEVYRLQLVAPTDVTSRNVEVTCQFIGIMSGGGSAAVPVEFKAPQLVLEDEEDEEAVAEAGEAAAGAAGAAADADGRVTAMEVDEEGDDAVADEDDASDDDEGSPEDAAAEGTSTRGGRRSLL